MCGRALATYHRMDLCGRIAASLAEYRGRVPELPSEPPVPAV